MSFPQQQPDIHTSFTSSEVHRCDAAYTSIDSIAYADDDATGAWGYQASIEETSLCRRMRLDLELVNSYLPAGPLDVLTYPETYPSTLQGYHHTSLTPPDHYLATPPMDLADATMPYVADHFSNPGVSAPATYYPYDHPTATSDQVQAVACIAPNLIHSVVPTSYLDPPAYPYTPSMDSDVGNPSPLAPTPSPLPSASSSPPAPQQLRSELITCQRRNVQVSRAAARASAITPPSDRWKCPHCDHVQENRRKPDLKRHIETHSPEAFYVCCGVPLVDALALGVPADVAHGSKVSEFEGIFMVGGCRRTFGRRDTYGRHLRRKEGICFGEPQALYQPGNRSDSRC